VRRGKRRVTSGSLKCDLNLAFRTISFGRKSSTGTEAVLMVSSWWEGRGRSREVAGDRVGYASLLEGDFAL
jgi:hypothetical protein